MAIAARAPSPPCLHSSHIRRPHPSTLRSYRARRARTGQGIHVNRQKCRIGGFAVTHVGLEACHRQPIVRVFALTAVLCAVLSHHVLQLSFGPPLSCREAYKCPRISVL